MNFISFFQLYFLNWDFLLIIKLRCLRFSGYVCNILMEGNLSQIFDLVPSFYLMSENGKHFAIFCKLLF